jgi:RHS repeat-associated protein
MPNRKINPGSYRYGFNGQENDGEVGQGITTAEFWEYDTRIGRRWENDPVVKPHESPYAAFANNPIWFADPTGADTALYNSSNGSEIKDARKIANGKSPIYTIDKIISGESSADMWKRAKPLKYSVGGKSEFKGITGKSFRKNHPLYNIGTKVGAQVFEEDLMDFTKEFNDVLKKAEGVFSNHRGSGIGGLAQDGSAYLLFDDDADYDLKSSSRDNFDEIPSYAAISIGIFFLL